MRKWLLLAMLLCSSAGAQTRINLIFIYTPDAADYAHEMGQSMQANAQDIVAQTNRLYEGAGIQFNLVNANAGYFGQADHLWGLPATSVTSEVVGAVRRMQRDIGTAMVRDHYDADIVVLVGDYDRGENPPIDVPGLSIGVCTNGMRAPSDGYVGINIQHQYFLTMNRSLLAHELGHQLCMEDAMGWSRKLGTTPQDCEVRWTMEYGDGTDELTNYPPYQSSCWKTVPGDACSSSGHAAIAAKVGSLPYPNMTCSYSGGTLGPPTHWSENVTCNPPGYVSPTWYADVYGTQTMPGFRCTNVAQLPYFAGNGPPPGYTGGTLTRNSLAAMQAQAPRTALFRNTKRAINMIRDAWTGLGTMFW